MSNGQKRETQDGPKFQEDHSIKTEIKIIEKTTIGQNQWTQIIQQKGENLIKRITHIIRKYEVTIIIMVKKDTLQRITKKKRNHSKTPKKYKQY